MFTADIYETKVYQQEMQRQAEHYRLVRSSAKSVGLADRITFFLGNLMVGLGQGLVAAAR
jgi:hypothetical protein